MSERNTPLPTHYLPKHTECKSAQITSLLFMTVVSFNSTMVGEAYDSMLTLTLSLLASVGWCWMLSLVPVA